MRRIRHRGKLATAFVVLLIVAGCGAWGAEDPWDGHHQDDLTITTGNPSGIYASYGEELGRLMAEHSGIDIEILNSGGSLENLERLASGEADLAFSAADAAADAAEGQGVFDDPLPVRALARIYDDFVHLVVPAASDITSIEGLRQRRVAVGALGSGTALIAERLIHSAGYGLDDIRPRWLSLSESVAAMQAGKVDALFWSGGLGTPALDDITEEMPIRLIPLDHLVEDLRSQFGSGYRLGAVPAGTYGLPDDVSTLAVPNVLLVRADAPDDLVRAQLTTLFEVQDQIAERVPAAALLDRSKAIFTDPVELHPGAIDYYRATAR